MRLSTEQTDVILDIVSGELGERLQFLGLFGSRLDDNRRGGDVDLLVKSKAHVSVLERATIKMKLENALGLPVDLLVMKTGSSSSPFADIASQQAIELGGAA